MDQVPEHRALLGVDVVGSARNPGHHLNAIRATVEESLSGSLVASGIDPAEVLGWESTGDGALLTLPSQHVGALMDSAQHLDTILSAHNRWRRPEVRCRIAIEVGPVGDEPGFYAAKIALTRLLNADTFKTVVAQCLDEREDGAVSSGLIVSDQVFRIAFGGDHTTQVRRGDFASLPVRDKEYTATAWVRVPGYDARTITRFAQSRQEQPRPPAPRARVINQVNGNMHGVQAETVHGNITFGSGPL